MNNDHLNIYNKAKSVLHNVEIYTSSSESHSVSFESDIFKKVESTQTQGLGLRTIYNDRIGFSFTNDTSDYNVIDRAKESSQFGEKALFQFAEKQSTNQMNLYDPQIKDTSIDSMIKMGEDAIDKIKSFDDNIKIDVGLEKETYSVHLMTSNGFSESYQKSLFSVSVSGLIAKNDQLLSIHKSKTRLSPFSGMDDIIDPIIEKFKLSKESSTIKTGKYKVLFTPRAIKSLVSILTSSLNGKAVQKGMSPLTERLGEQIISKNITLIDSGILENGISTAPFDGEGSLTRENILYDKGVLNTFIFDKQTAALLKRTSTGNASRGYASTPSPGLRNIIFKEGQYSYESLLAQIDDGILVDQFIGAGQSNVMAGEYSMNLELAFKINKGSLSGRLKDVMMSGNVFESLNHICGIGNTLFQEGSGYFPYILLDDIAISSKY